LLFLPDRLVLRTGRSFASIRYHDLDVTTATTEFLGLGRVPSDAHVVRHTWKHTTVKGAPDLRYKDNPRYSYACYGESTLVTTGRCFFLSRVDQVVSAAGDPAASAVGAALCGVRAVVVVVVEVHEVFGE
jgi:hypothetical protein